MAKQIHSFPRLLRTVAAITTLLTLFFSDLYCRYALDWLLSCAISCGTTAYHFLMRLAVGWLVPRCTGYDFDHRSPWFQPRLWEAPLYKALRIKQWKDRLPTYAPGQFSRREHTLHRIIQNMCGAEIVHELIMVFSFLPLVTVPFFGAFPVFFLTSLLAALYDSIFVMAQRYNRPRLVRIYEKQEARHP